MEYALADGETRERVSVDSVRMDGDVVHVYHTLTKMTKIASNKEVFQVDIQADSVSRRMGEQAEPLLKFPIKLGESWTIRLSRNQEFTRRIKSVSETVTVPAGTFRDCLVVEYESVTTGDTGNIRYRSTSYYAPDVGLVKLEHEQPEYHRYGLELISVGAEENR